MILSRATVHVHCDICMFRLIPAEQLIIVSEILSNDDTNSRGRALATHTRSIRPRLKFQQVRNEIGNFLQRP